MALALIGIQLSIMLWSLKALKRLPVQLKELYENKREALDDSYSIEILPVTKNFNTILRHEKYPRKRYRDTLSVQTFF